MRKKINKTLALLMAFALCFSSVNIQAFAQIINDTEQAVINTTEETTVEETAEGEVLTESITEQELSTQTQETTENEQTTDVEGVSTEVEETVSEEESVIESQTQTEEATTVEEVITEAETEETAVTESETNNWDGVTTENIYEAENYKVTFALTSYWDTGYNANIKIENTGDTVIHNWYLNLDYDSEISNIWNGQIYEKTQSGYIIKNAGWNQDIAVKGAVEFGISGNEAFKGFPKSYELTGTGTEVKTEDYGITYSIESDWGSGFTGSIAITNNTDTTLEDWVLEFDFDSEITEIWNGVIESYEENHYVIRNSGYNSNIATGATVSVGFKGGAAGEMTEPENYKLYSYKLSEGNKITFVVGAENAVNIPEVQIVNDGDYVIKPKDPIREGYYFMGWYLDDDFKECFDFDNIVINNDIVLYARWLDYLCDTDSDKDGIVDSLEEYFGTDLYDKDTDNDNIDDYQEIYEVGTHPLLSDSDGNGVNDYNDDIDGDGIVNGDEVLYNTNASYDDTDIDDLTDYDELFVYFTDPTLDDTDGDRASDGWEIAKGYNPLVADDSFVLTASSGSLSETNPIVAKVNMEVYDADVESLVINKVYPHDNPFITPFIAGYLGEAYDFSIDGKFDMAELIFEYDSSLGQLSDEFQPRIYYFNEETKMFEELENQIVEEGRVIAKTSHFSTYILLNKVEFDKVWNTEIKTSSNGEFLNIAYVVDLSGSMSSRKLSTTKTAITSFIDILEDTDKAALISFNSNASVRCGITEDKDVLKNAVKNMLASGFTSIYKGIEKGIEVFKNANPAGYKIMIVFTDGYDEPSTTYDVHYKALVESAKENEITIYTVGISTIDAVLLTRIAEETGGKYYYASAISELQNKVDEIKDETLDYKTDSNNDGITDYHTKLIEEGKLLLCNSSNELKGINFNYGQDGEAGGLSADWDGDGVKNGDEIKVTHNRGKIYLEMHSHPLYNDFDEDDMGDYMELYNDTNPLEYEIDKTMVDRLCTDGHYYFENVANQMKDDKFVEGLIGYSAIVNGVWNKQELYRDLIIDYYSSCVTQDVIDDEAFKQQKDILYDYLVNLKTTYDGTYNIDKMINYLKGARKMDDLEESFIDDVKRLIITYKEASEEGTKFRFEMNGMEYVKKHYDSKKVLEFVGGSKKVLDICSNGTSLLIYSDDIFNSISQLAVAEANKEVFDENMLALERISTFSDDKYIRAAAKEVQDLIGEKYLLVFKNVIKDDIIKESVPDYILYDLASKIGYVAIVVAVRDAVNLFLDSKTDVQQMYRILCYSEICDTYISPIYIKCKMAQNPRYYTCLDFNAAAVRDSLVHTAQLRIMGELEYYAYIKNDSFVWKHVEEHFEILNGLKDEIEHKISTIKECASKLKLELAEIKYELK